MSEGQEKQAKRRNKVSHGIVSAGCAAVVAVYTAGYLRTQAASEQFASRIAQRRPAVVRPAPVEHVADVVAPIAPAVEAPAPKVEAKPAEQAHVAAKTKPKPIETAAAAPVDADAALPAPAAPPAEPAVAPAAAEVISDPAPLTIVAPAVPPASIAPPAATPAVAKTPATPAAPAAPATPVWKDGTYRGWGYSRHGNIEAEVVIENSRIKSAVISQCRTRYSCNVIEQLPPEVVQRQSPEVDYVSGATQSADAFYGAVVAALNQAK